MEVDVNCPNVAAVHLMDFEVWVLCIYRPSSYSAWENEVLIGVILDFCEGRKVVILGDFNLPSLLWLDDGVFGDGGGVDQMFLNFFAAAGLTQWVREATFLSSGNILDLFFTSETNRVEDVKVLASLPKCGHSPVVCEYLFASDQDSEDHVLNERYLWHKGDYHGMSYALLGTDWEFDLVHLDADAAYRVFLWILAGLVDVYVPTSSSVHRLPWFINPPAVMRLARTEAWKYYKSLRAVHGRHGEPTLAALVQFNYINYQFQNFVKSSRAQYEQRLINGHSGAPKLFHSYIRKKKKGQMAVGLLKIPTSRITDSLEDMAKSLDTFASVFVGEGPVNAATNQTYGGTMPDIMITVDRVHETLLCLNVSSTMGPDNVHPHVLRACGLSICYFQ